MLCQEFLNNLLVLFGLYGTGGIDKRSSLPHMQAGFVQDLCLQMTHPYHVIQLPVPANLRMT